MLRDRFFGAAMVAAPLFWLVLLATGNQSPDLAWPLRSPAQFLLLCVAYPVLEELAFRGFLQGLLRQTAWGARAIGRGSSGATNIISGANVVTSLVFALCHLWRHAPLWAGLTFFPSLIFGFFRDRTGSVIPPIILHVFYNAGYFWLFGSAQGT